MKKINLIVIVFLVLFFFTGCKNEEQYISGGEMLKIDLYINYSNECSFFLPLISNKEMKNIEIKSINGENIDYINIIATLPQKNSEDILKIKKQHVTLLGVKIITQDKTVFPLKIESFQLMIDGKEFIYETPSINIRHYKLLSEKAVYLSSPDFVYESSVPLMFNNLFEKEINLDFLSKSDIILKKYYASAFIEYDDFTLNNYTDNMNIECTVSSGQVFYAYYKLKASPNVESYHIIRASRIIQYSKPGLENDFFFIAVNGYCIQDIENQVGEYIERFIL